MEGDKAQRSIVIPGMIDCLQGILNIIPMQLLSMHIAEMRSCDVRSMVSWQEGSREVNPLLQKLFPLTAGDCAIALCLLTLPMAKIS